VHRFREKKKRKRIRSDAVIAAALIPIILVIGLSASWLGGYGLIPIDANITMPLTFVAIILAICFLMGSISSTDTWRKTPKYVTVDSHSRVVKDPATDQEYIVTGTGEMTVRDALLFDWFFKDRNRNSEWYALNEDGTDVSEKMIADFEGTIIVEFRDDNLAY
jgi:hypothetical protein